MRILLTNSLLRSISTKFNSFKRTLWTNWVWTYHISTWFRWCSIVNHVIKLFHTFNISLNGLLISNRSIILINKVSTINNLCTLPFHLTLHLMHRIDRKALHNTRKVFYIVPFLTLMGCFHGSLVAVKIARSYHYQIVMIIL